jgi:hypothetical protein
MSGTDLFISHSSEDGPMVKALAAELELRGFTAWYHERDSVAVESHLSQTARAIQAARIFLVVISHSALKSREVISELERAHELGKPICPVTVTATWEEIKAREIWDIILGTRVAVSVDAARFESELPRLIDGLIAELDRPAIHSVPEVPRFRFRLISARTTNPSVPSVLGTVESIVGAAAFLYLTVRKHTLEYWAAAVFASLFVLFRTDESVELGLELYDRCTRRIKHLGQSGTVSAAAAVIFLVFFVLVGPAILRIVATAAMTLRHPWRTLSAVPDNWTRIVLCMDTLTPPEILPGAEADPRNRGPRFDHFFGSSFNPETGQEESGAASIAYYWTLAVVWRLLAKSAAIYWIPVLWAAVPAAWTARQTPEPERAHLLAVSVRTGIPFGLSVAASLFALVGALIKLVVWSWPSVESECRATMPWVLDQIIVPRALPSWQAAALANALLTIAIYLWADRVRLGGYRLPACLRLFRGCGWVFPVRRVLTMYTCAIELLLLTNHLPDVRKLAQWWTPRVPRRSVPADEASLSPRRSERLRVRS